MKRILLLVSSLTVFRLISDAQIDIHASLEDLYRDFMVKSHTQFNKTILNGFQGLGGEQRFQSRDWMNGSATNNNDVVISDSYQFNYDFIEQELYAKWKDTSIIVNSNYLKAFSLQDKDGVHHFVKATYINNIGIFYESLGYDETNKSKSAIQLLKFRSVKVIKNNKNDYLANFNGDYTDKMNSKYEYYLVMPDKRITKIKMNRSAVIEALGSAYKSRIESFFQQDQGKFNEQQAGALIRYLNKS